MPNDPSSVPSIRGLSETDAQARLKTEGYNELPRPDRRTPLRIIIEVMREPMLALLLGGGVIYLLLGDLKEALILLAFAMMSVSITVVQETRTERVLEALRDLSSPRALVIRDGARKHASPAATSSVAISWCLPRATACPLMRCSFKATTCRPTNRC